MQLNNKKWTLTFWCILFLVLSMTTLGSNKIWDDISYYLYKPIAFLLPHYEQRKIIYNKETQYFNINVEEDEAGRRHLVFLPRRGSQSVYDPADPSAIFSNYIKYSLLAFALQKKSPGKILFLGLGGGILPMAIRKIFPNAEMDIVEIDPGVYKIAKKYFGFKTDDNIHIFFEDGRVFVNRCRKKYDAVFIDVYNAYNIPFQFTTKEFYNHIKRIMNNDAVCAINVANMGNADFIKNELLTVKSVFSASFIFATAGNTNFVPVIINSSNFSFLKFKKEVMNCNNPKLFLDNKKTLLSHCMSLESISEITKGGTVITDDFAPVY